MERGWRDWKSSGKTVLWILVVHGLCIEAGIEAQENDRVGMRAFETKCWREASPLELRGGGGMDIDHDGRARRRQPEPPLRPRHAPPGPRPRGPDSFRSGHLRGRMDGPGGMRGFDRRPSPPRGRGSPPRMMGPYNNPPKGARDVPRGYSRSHSPPRGARGEGPPRRQMSQGRDAGSDPRGAYQHREIQSEDHDMGRGLETTQGQMKQASHELKVDMGTKCLVLLQSFGGTADIAQLNERWKILYPNDSLSRDGLHVFRDGVSVSFEEAMLATSEVSILKDSSRSGGKIFTLETALAGGLSQGKPAAVGHPAGGGPKHVTLHKTRLCRDWVTQGRCQFGSACSFAHGRNELRAPGTYAEGGNERVANAELQEKLSKLPIPIVAEAANYTFEGKIMRVMSSDSYPPEAHFCISESAEGVADVFVSRKLIDDTTWNEIHTWYLAQKGKNPTVIHVRAQAYKKGSNNWRAIEYLGKTSSAEEKAFVEQASKFQSGPGEATAEDADQVDHDVPKNGDDPSSHALPIDGDFKPKKGYQGVITSSGKNFSFADDCIYISHEVRDGHGIRGLWVGDIVAVDIFYNILRKNWVATSVVLLQRNNTGFLSMQEEQQKINAVLAERQGGNNILDTSTDTADKSKGADSTSRALGTLNPSLLSGNLSSLLKDPTLLQGLISALQKTQGQESTPDLSEDQRNVERMKLNYKTEMCVNIAKIGRCRYGSKCTFAHSKDELRTIDDPLPDHVLDGPNKRTERPDDQVDLSSRKRSKNYNKDREFSDGEACAGELFVSGLGRDLTEEEDLKSIFSPYGEVEEARIVVEASSSTSSRGSGFIRYANPLNNLKAIEELDGFKHVLTKKKLRILPASKASEDHQEESEEYLEDDPRVCTGELYVGGLDRRLRSPDELRAMFTPFGEVKDARIIFDTAKSPPVSRCFGFVEFVDPKNNFAAIRALDGTKNPKCRKAFRVIPASSSNSFQEDSQNDIGEESADQSLLADDYVDPQQMQVQGGTVDEFTSAAKLIPDSHSGHNMHVSMMQGLPNYMEDNWSCLPCSAGSTGTEVTKESISFYGVYDGHNGYRASLYGREMLLQKMLELLPVKPTVEDIHIATDQAYTQVDKEFLALGMLDGACVVTLTVTPTHLVAANAGDSRAVLAKAGKSYDLTVDHKPGRPDEQQRIEDLGGFVVVLGVPRVMGYLAVSRAIGNLNLKYFVTSKPEIKAELRANDNDFVIMATDGLWDVMSSEEAVQFVYRNWDLPDHGAESIVQEAFHRGSYDNICAMVINLKDRNEHPSTTSGGDQLPHGGEVVHLAQPEDTKPKRKRAPRKSKTGALDVKEEHSPEDMGTGVAAT